MPALSLPRPPEPVPPTVANCPTCVSGYNEAEARWYYQIVRGCRWHSGPYDPDMLPDRPTAIARIRARVDPWVAPQ